MVQLNSFVKRHGLSSLKLNLQLFCLSSNRSFPNMEPALYKRLTYSDALSCFERHNFLLYAKLMNYQFERRTTQQQSFHITSIRSH